MNSGKIFIKSAYIFLKICRYSTFQIEMRRHMSGHILKMIFVVKMYFLKKIKGWYIS